MLFLILLFYLVLFFYFYDLIHIPYRLKFRRNKFLPMIIFVIKTKSYRLKKFSPRMYFNIVTAYLCLNFPLFSELLVLFFFATCISLALCSSISFAVRQFSFRSATIFDSTFSFVTKNRLQILPEVKASLSELIPKVHWCDQCSQYSIYLLPVFDMVIFYDSYHQIYH